MSTDIRFPLAKETINSEDVDALCEWLKSYPRLTKGELTWQVEERWANFIGTRKAVFNNSGSSANLLMVYAAIMCGRIKNKKIAILSSYALSRLLKDLEETTLSNSKA